MHFLIYRSVASHNQKPFTAEDAEEAKVSLCVSDLALFQFLKTFSSPKLEWKGG